MEVVMVNVDHFDRVPVMQCVRNGISDDRFLVEVDRALVVGVVQLCRTDQRIETWWVNVICDFFLMETYMYVLI